MSQPPESTPCYLGFGAHEVVPCRYDNATPPLIPISRYRGFHPIYELRHDGSGEPYSSLLSLKADKMAHFLLELPLRMKIGGFLPVRYEDLLRQGTASLIRQIADMVGIEPPCTPTCPHPDRMRARSIDPEFQKWIQDHMDVATERLLGYA